MVDRDMNGKISLEDLRRIFPDVDEQEAIDMIAAADLDGDAQRNKQEGWNIVDGRNPFRTTFKAWLKPLLADVFARGSSHSRVSSVVREADSSTVVLSAHVFRGPWHDLSEAHRLDGDRSFGGVRSIPPSGGCGDALFLRRSHVDTHL